jgi:hypothetical protein
MSISVVFNKSREVAGLSGCMIESILGCMGENINEANPYASYKFIGGRSKFVLNASNCSLYSHTSVMITRDVVDLYEWMSKILPSWNSCGSCR